MSQENVAAVRRVIDVFTREGHIPVDLVHPDVVWSNFRESPMPGPYRGHEGARKWLEDIDEVVDELRFEIDDLVDFDEADAVIFKTHLHGRAKHTGLELLMTWTTVQWFRDGRISRSESYTDHAEAREAVGLRE
jgi:ketosteroid isomerase-like protein